MPNEPLQTYRAVDPVGYHFGSIATTASQPFVLGHFTSTSHTGAGATNQAMSFSSSALDADRFVPWVARNFDNSTTTGSYYPVAVPNAYDRILIFPMYRLVRSAGITHRPASNSAQVALRTSPDRVAVRIANSTALAATPSRARRSTINLPSSCQGSAGWCFTLANLLGLDRRFSK